MSRPSFDDFRKSLIENNAFKKINKKSIPQYKEILLVLYKTKNKLRAKEIQEKMTKEIKISSLNTKLKSLEIRGLIKVSGRRRTYLKDTLNDKACFGATIGEVIDLSFINLLKDCIKRPSIKRIFLEILEEYKSKHGIKIDKIISLLNNPGKSYDLDTIMDIIKTVLDDDLFDLYDKSMFTIIDRKLYNKDNCYGKLERQSMANKYQLVITE